MSVDGERFNHVIGGPPGLGGEESLPLPGVPKGDGLVLLNRLIQNRGPPLCSREGVPGLACRRHSDYELITTFFSDGMGADRCPRLTEVCLFGVAKHEKMFVLAQRPVGPDPVLQGSGWSYINMTTGKGVGLLTYP